MRSDWPQHWESILDAGNQRPPLALRVNVRRTSREALLERFAQRRASARAPKVLAGIVVDVPRPVHELPGFEAGEFSVQDLGAQLAAPLLGVANGLRVLDACAAPGGKTSHLLESADIELTALDTDASRLQRVRDNIARLGLDGPHVRIAHADAAQPSGWWDGTPFDRILADVPCTASGVVRRHPDGKWLRRPTDLAGFAAQQRALLDGLWPTLARGRPAAVRDVLGVPRGERDADRRIPRPDARCVARIPQPGRRYRAFRGATLAFAGRRGPQS